MKNRLRGICVVFAILLWVQGICVSAMDSGASPSAIANRAVAGEATQTELSEDAIDRYVEAHEDTTAGMAVAVFDQSTELLRKYYGFADVERKLPVDAETVFEWGSATKLLVWVSVMQLYEQGKMDLEADIRTYLPEGFLKNLDYDTPVTMINLMNHNAGFQECYVDLFIKDSAYISGLGEALQKHEPAQIYEPGTVTAYSNWGVALAGYIVERVSGVPFDAYVRRNIFEPLQMEHSAVSVDLSDNAWVKEKRGELQCYTTERELIPDCFYYITLYPAGMCTSTLEDFETFARALLDENSVLFQSPQTRTELFTPTAHFGETGIPKNFHGFWMISFGTPTIGHGGNTAGCSSYLLLDMEKKLGAVVMTNQAQESIYNTGMMELIFGQYKRGLYSGDESVPGIYRTARTVRKGPLKFLSISYRGGELEDDVLWTLDESSGRRKIIYSYGDYIEVPTGVFVLEIGLLLLWVAAVAASVITLLWRLVRLPIRKLRKKEPTRYALSGWRISAAVLQLLALLMFLWVWSRVSALALADTYAWMFAVIGVLGIFMFALSVYGIFKGRKAALKLRQRLCNGMISILLLGTVANICYWNLFMFWAL